MNYCKTCDILICEGCGEFPTSRWTKRDVCPDCDEAEEWDNSKPEYCLECDSTRVSRQRYRNEYYKRKRRQLRLVLKGDSNDAT